MGVSIHHSVQSVALDTLVEHRLGGEGKVRPQGQGCLVTRALALALAGLVLANPALQHARAWPNGLRRAVPSLAVHSPAHRAAQLLPAAAAAPQNVARWEKDRLRMSILEEANIGGAGRGEPAGVGTGWVDGCWLSGWVLG